MIGRHRFVDQRLFGLRFARRELLLEVGDDAVGEPSGLGIVALALRLGERIARVVELFLEFLRLADLVLFRLPACGQRVRLLLQLAELGAEFYQPVARGGVALLAQRLLLDLELDDAPVELVELFGLAVDLHTLARGRFVDEVDRLVGQEAVGDVAVGQRRRRDQRGVGDVDAVVDLVLLLESAQDRDRVLDGGLADEHRLEAPRQRRVLFDVLAKFVERGRADAVQLATGERGLQQVRGVHRALGLAGADQRVHLVDEQDDAALGRGDLVEHGLEPLFELAAVFCPGDEGAHIERQQFFVAQGFRHVAVDDA